MDTCDWIMAGDVGRQEEGEKADEETERERERESNV